MKQNAFWINNKNQTTFRTLTDQQNAKQYITFNFSPCDLMVCEYEHMTLLWYDDNDTMMCNKLMIFLSKNVNFFFSKCLW